MIQEVKIEFDAQTQEKLVNLAASRNPMKDKEHFTWLLGYIIENFIHNRQALADWLQYHGFVTDSQALKIERGQEWKVS